jgi:hypothetical protein
LTLTLKFEVPSKLSSEILGSLVLTRAMLQEAFETLAARVFERLTDQKAIPIPSEIKVGRRKKL